MRKRTKRVISLVLTMLLAVVMVFSSVGCSGKGTENPGSGTQDQGGSSDGADKKLVEGIEVEPGAELRVWDASDTEGKYIEEVGKQFEEKYGIPVKFEAVDYGDVPDKMKTDGPAGLAADIFALPHDNIGDLLEAGLIYENDVLNPDDYMDAAVTAVSSKGKMYGYPAAIDTYALFYNKDLVKEPPKTFDELIAFCKEFNDIKKQKYGFMMEVTNFYFVYGFVGGYGGYVFGENGTNPADIGLNNEAAVEAFKFQQKLKEVLPVKSGDIDYNIKNGLFNEGKLAFDLNGPWAVQGYKDAGVNFGVMPLPTLPNGEHPKSFSGVRAYFVNSYTKYPNAAKAFAKFMTSKDSLKVRYMATNNIPPRKDLLTDPDIAGNEVSAAFLEQASYAQPMPSIPEMALVWDPMRAALTTNWDKGGDPKPALDNAVNAIKEAIKVRGQE